MARAKRARRYGPGESLPGKVPLPRAEDEGGTCGGRVGGWSGEVEGGGGGGRTGSDQTTGFRSTGAGGSGVIILRMPTAAYLTASTTGSPTVTTDGTDTILTYTGSGTYRS